MLHIDAPLLNEATLIHFGVKGMRWGVRKEEEKSSRKSGDKKDDKLRSKNPYALTDEDKAILKGAGVKPSDSASMQEKYGSGTLSKDPPKHGRLTEGQKDVIKSIVVVAGVAGAAWFLYHRSNKALQDDYFRRINPVERVPAPAGRPRNMENFRNEWNNYLKVAGGREGSGYTKEMVDRLGADEIDLKAGTIFKRISTEQETTIRPGGFYASHREEDVNRYKAILPIYWKMWGKSANSGYVVNIKANADVKAPSPKKTYEMFKGMLNDEVGSSQMGIPRRRLRDFFPFGNDGDDDTAARKAFPHFVQAWANEEHPGTRHFFSRLKGDGYNAVIDMNDAGALSSRPMRLLDGSLFEIAGHDRLSASAIADAQENIKAVIHAALTLMGMYTAAGEEYLAHAGVKGMKWGVRKARDIVGLDRAPLTPQQQQERRNTIAKAAIGVGVVAVGAILLKRGGFKLSTPASKKIALGGAKMSLRIIQKSGRLMASTSVKVGQTAGKVAVKGTAKIGTVAGKGAYKGALAGGKAAGKAIAQNGSKFYENVIKKSALSAVKLGSHGMYKLTGRGQPIVNDVARRSFNLNPSDLLLNVRSDSWRGR